MSRMRAALRGAVQALLGVGLTGAGIAHLTTERETFLAQVPDWLAIDADVVVVVSGVVELVLGPALLVVLLPAVSRWRPAVGVAVAVFFVSIFPGNITQFVERRDAFGLDSDLARGVRLLFQPPLVVAALWSTGSWPPRSALGRIGAVTGRWTAPSRHHGQGMSIGALFGLSLDRGDRRGLLASLPALAGVERRPILTGVYRPLGGAAVVEETADDGASELFYLWIDAGLDADVVRDRHGSIERTHDTRGGLADRAVHAVATAVPDATVVWARAGSAPPPALDRFDQVLRDPRRIGIEGSGPRGAIGLAFRADLMTNPVAWLRWLRDLVLAVVDDEDPPPPPAVGFG